MSSIKAVAASPKYLAQFFDSHPMNFLNFIFYFRDIFDEFFGLKEGFKDRFIHIFSTSSSVDNVYCIIEYVKKFLERNLSRVELSDSKLNSFKSLLIFFIHLIACPCGSIINGHLRQLKMNIPLSVDN